MKKIVLTLIAILSVTMAFAGEREKNHGKVNNAQEVTVQTMDQNYDMTLNYRKLGSTLGLNGYQMKAVELIHDKFVNEMKDAERAEASDRKELVQEAAGKELKYMRYVLDGDQYDKFATLLNLTLSNRGLLK
jgi:hypothetical protein